MRLALNEIVKAKFLRPVLPEEAHSAQFEIGGGKGIISVRASWRLAVNRPVRPFAIVPKRVKKWIKRGPRPWQLFRSRRGERRLLLHRWTASLPTVPGRRPLSAISP